MPSSDIPKQLVDDPVKEPAEHHCGRFVMMS